MVIIFYHFLTQSRINRKAYICDTQYIIKMRLSRLHDTGLDKFKVGGVVMSLFRTEEGDPTEWGEDEEEDPEAEFDEDIFDEED